VYSNDDINLLSATSLTSGLGKRSLCQACDVRNANLLDVLKSQCPSTFAV
jgi:hypothetical protein